MQADHPISYQNSINIFNTIKTNKSFTFSWLDPLREHLPVRKLPASILVVGSRRLTIEMSSGSFVYPNEARSSSKTFAADPAVVVRSSIVLIVKLTNIHFVGAAFRRRNVVEVLNYILTAGGDLMPINHQIRALRRPCDTLQCIEQLVDQLAVFAVLRCHLQPLVNEQLADVGVHAVFSESTNKYGAARQHFLLLAGWVIITPADDYDRLVLLAIRLLVSRFALGNQSVNVFAHFAFFLESTHGLEHLQHIVLWIQWLQPIE